MNQDHHTDLDERGLAKRDIIDGDSLTLVGYKKNKNRRVSLAIYLTGKFPNPHMRRCMGWIQPSLDGDPPHAEILNSLLRQQENQKKRAKNIEKAKAARAAHEAKQEAKRLRKMEARK